MGWGNILKRFGRWTTIVRFNEPFCYRIRLRGDALVRVGVALGVGLIFSGVLLIPFAVNVDPPPAIAALLVGVALFGGMTALGLFNHLSNARGTVRLCEEGIVRLRWGVSWDGISWQEELSWPYGEMEQATIIPGQAIRKSFAVVIITTAGKWEIFGIPRSVAVEQIAQMLATRGVAVQHADFVPEHFRKPMHWAFGMGWLACGMPILVGGLIFYVVRTREAAEQQIVFHPPARLPVKPIRQVERPTWPDAIAAPPAPPPVPAQPAPAGKPPVNAEEKVSEPAPPRGFGPQRGRGAGPAGGPPGIGPPRMGPPSMGPRFGPRGPGGPGGGRKPATPEAVAKGGPTDLGPGDKSISAPDRKSTQLPSTREKKKAPETKPKPATPEYEPPAGQPGEITKLAGGPEGWPFQSVDRDRKAVVGFRYRLGRWSRQAVVARLEPLYDREAQPNGMSLSVAREGYVAGGVHVVAGDLVNAVRIIFVRQAPDGALEKGDFYLGDWFGEPGDDFQVLGDGQKPVIGVCGRHGAVINALALVLDDR